MLDASRKLGTFGHGYTYTAHPVGAAIALRTLEIYKRDKIIERAAQLGKIFQARLAKFADHPLVGEARGRGLIGAVELVADKSTKRAFQPAQMVGAKTAEFAQKHGLLIRAMGDAIGICPPLIITKEEIADLFDRLERALDDAQDWVVREGLAAG